MSLAGLLCVVISGPCGWVEFVDLLHAVFFRAGSQVLLSFKLPSFLLKFNGFPVHSNVNDCWCCPAFQYFEIEFHVQLVLGHVQLRLIFPVVLLCSVSHVL